MLINISLFVCLSLLIYSYFVFSRSKSDYANMKKVASILNLGVGDKYSKNLNAVAYGQYSKHWFLKQILDKCNNDNKTEREIYDNLPSCLYPFCQIETPISQNIRNVLP